MSSEYPFSDLPTIDEAVVTPLKNLLGNSFCELVDDYLKDFPVKFNNLKKARDGNDVATVYIISHTLKSSSGSFGFTRLYKQLEHLELQARNDSLIDSADQIEFIQQEFNTVLKLMDKE